MAKSESISYQSVAKQCNELVKSNEKPTVRKLHAQLGGSFSTISEHLNQWRAQQELAQSVENELSEEFNQALLAEFARITSSVKKQSIVLLAEKEEQLAEARELLAEFENKLAAGEKKYKDAVDKSQSEQLELEKKLAVARGDAESAKLREAGLQEKVDQLIDKCHQAELRAAVAETKVVEQGKR